MHRAIGAVSGFFLVSALGSCLDPKVTVGAVNAGWLMFSAGAMGYVIGSIADALWRQRS